MRDCIWYALNREGIPIPGPLRTVTLKAGDAGITDNAQIGQRFRVLRGAHLFADLSDDDLNGLAQLAQTRLYAPREAIIRQGDPGDEYVCRPPRATECRRGTSRGLMELR